MYSVALSLRGRRVLVAGGGNVAERKVRSLLDAAADITVVSPVLCAELATLASQGRIAWKQRGYQRRDLDGALLAFAATDDEATNASLVDDARAAGILVNDATNAARGDFATPAVHRAGALTVTVDSSGLSPSFTKRIRDELAVQFDVRYARAAATLGALRERTQAVVPAAQRAAVMRHFAERDIDELAAMRHDAIEHEVERAVDTLSGVVPAQAKPLVCASRSSKLAMVQTRAVMAQLAAAGIPSTVVQISTRGDEVQDRSIAAIGTDNVFVKELELALREGRADYAVHSCKDLPSTLADDMMLAGVTRREDARDAFCSERYATFADLPAGARVGTSSPRRRAQLRALRPDLFYDDVRGNVDTRLRKLREGQYDAIVLACAGLSRLDLRATYTVPFPVSELTPAIAQGALGIETHRGASISARLAAILEDTATSIAVRAERAFLRTLRGGCLAPVGCHGVWNDGTLHLTAAIAAADGSQVLRRSEQASIDVGDVAAAEFLGTEFAQTMLTQGGAALLGTGPLSGRLMLLPRTQERASQIAPALREAGAEVVEAPDSAAARSQLGERVPSVVLFPSSGSVGAVAEYLEGLRRDGKRPIIAAMGPSSSKTAESYGWPPNIVAASPEIHAFVQSVMLYILENGA